MATQEAEEFRWESIEANAIVPGMYVRGTANGRPRAWTPEPVEGEVLSVSHVQDMISLRTPTEPSEVRDLSPRNWEQRLPVEQATPAQATGRWVPAEHGEFSVGDRVRVTSRETGAVDEAVVEATTCNMGDPRGALVIRRDDGRTHCRHVQYRTFEKWVVEASVPAFTWVTVPSTRLHVGDHVRGVSARRDNIVEGVVESVSGAGYVRLDTSAARLSPARRWERRTTVQGTAPAPDQVAATPEVATEVFNPFDEPPREAPPAPDSGASAGAERALPSWATSLDAARRYVHEQAIDLWRAGHNCWDGTYDFLDELDLPTKEEWPEADESAEIRNFLTEAREAALAQAENHGKDSEQVRAWLREHGIVPAPPALARHEFTVLTPVGVNARQILLDLGWVVRD